jgi:SAM-dependent methyltransferase
VTGGAVDPDAFAAFEAAGWEEQADGYHRFFQPVTSRAVEPLLDAVGVRGGTRVLDVASGPGYVASVAARLGATAVGVDVAARMVALASTLHPAVEFLVADGEQLPFGDGSFDAVVANLALPHFGRPERAAGEVARVLVPGGRAALSMWDSPEHNRLLGVFVDAVAEVGVAPSSDVPAGPPTFRFSDENELVGLLTGAGLIDVVVQTVSFAHPVGSAEELWDGLLGGTVRSRALVLGQSEDTQRRVREAFERLTGKYLVGDGHLEVPVAFKVASGRKPA